MTAQFTIITARFALVIVLIVSVVWIGRARRVLLLENAFPAALLAVVVLIFATLLHVVGVVITRICLV